jgi:hypothetical protein
MEVYKLIGRTVREKDKASDYVVKDKDGNTAIMTSSKIKYLIRNGDIFHGVEVRNNRLYTTEKVDKIPVTEIQKSEYTRDYRVC